MDQSAHTVYDYESYIYMIFVINHEDEDNVFLGFRGA